MLYSLLVVDHQEIIHVLFYEILKDKQPVVIGVILGEEALTRIKTQTVL